MKKKLLFQFLFLFLTGILTLNAQSSTMTVPFELTSIDEQGNFKNPKWYLVNMNENNTGGGHKKGYLTVNNTDTSMDFFFDANQVNPEDNKQLWCFVANGDGGYRIYNKEKGATKCVTYASDLAIFNVPTDNNSTWILTETSNVGYKSRGGFCFKNAHSNQYLNKQDSKMKFWRNPDEGSTFFIQLIDDASATQKLEQAITKANQYNGLIGSALGQYTDNGNAFSTALKAATDAQNDQNTSAGTKLNCANKLEAAITALRLNMPQTGKFYRFQGDKSKRYASSKDNVPEKNYKIKLVTDKGTNGETVYYYSNDKRLTGCSMLNVNGNQNNKADMGGTFTIKAHTGKIGCYVIKPNSANNWCDWDASGYYFVDAWNADNFERTAWHIEEVTDLNDQPKLTKTMTADYATISAPVALKIPEGVAAYAASVDESKQTASLTPFSEIIPANTGAVLKRTSKSESSFTFTCTNGGSPQQSNNLKPVLKDKEIPAGTNAYVLANKNGKIGFYILDSNTSNRTIGKGKAYLEIPAATTASVFSIVIGGTTTGLDEIQNSVSENNKEEYFDLQGRRVLKPSKGLYITKSGKKIFFK